MRLPAYRGSTHPRSSGSKDGRAGAGPVAQDRSPDMFAEGWGSGGRHPVAVKTGGHTMGQMHEGQWRLCEALCVEDHQGGRLAGHVHHQPHQPTLVLRCIGMRWHEDEFARKSLRTEIMAFAPAGLQVVLQQVAAGTQRRTFLGQRHGVGIPVGLSGTPLVAARKLLRLRVQHLALHHTPDRIDGPPFQGGLAGVRPLRAVGKHAGVGDDVDESELEHAPELHRYARGLAFQVWEEGRKLRLHSANAPDTRLSPQERGFSDVESGGRAWRVYSSLDRKGRVLVQVAEERRSRDRIAGSVAGALLLPMIVGLPVLGLLIWLALRSG